MSIVNEKSSSPKAWGQIAEPIALVVLLGIDQLSKWWSQMHDLAVMNFGGVFGFMPSVWWGAVLVLVWGLIAWEWWRMRWDICRWGLGFIVVGGLGNIVDRILFGSVRDFIYYPGFGFYGNVADIYLAFGVIIVVLGKLKKGWCFDA